MQNTIFQWVARAIVLLTAMPIHECAHGFVADRLGDRTAREQGRLTLNPIAHLDPLGSMLLIFTGFGWAKPVQVDARRFAKPRRDMAFTALAGPVSNILLALFTMIVYKLLGGVLPFLRNISIANGIDILLFYMIYINLYLAVFNLLPVPPLDGAKIFGAVLPDKYYFTIMRYERYLSIALFILIFTRVLSGPLSYVARAIFYALNVLTKPLGWIS